MFLTRGGSDRVYGNAWNDKMKCEKYKLYCPLNWIGHVSMNLSELGKVSSTSPLHKEMLVDDDAAMISDISISHKWSALEPCEGDGGPRKCHS